MLFGGLEVRFLNSGFNVNLKAVHLKSKYPHGIVWQQNIFRKPDCAPKLDIAQVHGPLNRYKTLSPKGPRTPIMEFLGRHTIMLIVVVA